MEPESTQSKAEPDVAAAEPTSRLNAVGIKRRALLRAGAGATPVLLTFGSGPVSATNIPCTVASSFVSARTFASRNAKATTMTCTSINAVSWNSYARSNCGGDRNDGWPSWAKQPLRDHLPCAGTSSYDDEWVGWILKGRTSGGADCATTGPLAVLQLILGLTMTMQYSPSSIQTAVSSGDPVTKSYLASVWSQYKQNQRLVVAGSVNWTEADILRWLRLLQNNISVSSMFT